MLFVTLKEGTEFCLLADGGSLITIFPPSGPKTKSPMRRTERGMMSVTNCRHAPKAIEQIVTTPSGTMYSESLNVCRTNNSRWPSRLYPMSRPKGHATYLSDILSMLLGQSPPLLLESNTPPSHWPLSATAFRRRNKQIRNCPTTIFHPPSYALFQKTHTQPNLRTNSCKRLRSRTGIVTANVSR